MSSSHQQVRYEIEHGSIWIRMNSGRYWKVRCNGATQLWKRDLFRYRIPVKAGMYLYTEITNKTEIGTFDSDYAFICSRTDPNTCKYRAAIKKLGKLLPAGTPLPPALQREQDLLNGIRAA